MVELQARLQISTQAHEALQAEYDNVQKQLHDTRRQLGEHSLQLAEAERRLAREQRRVKKAEEETELLRKALRQQQQQAWAPPSNDAPPAHDPVLLSAVREAIALLQQGVNACAVGAGEAVPAQASIPAPAPPAPLCLVKKIPLITVTLPTPHGKEHYTMSRVLAALRRNDPRAAGRDSQRHRASRPRAPARAVPLWRNSPKGGSPEALLNGPLRPGRD